MVVVGLCVASFYALADGVSTGITTLPLRRMPIEFSRHDSPIGFFACLSIYSLLGLGSLWFSGKLLLALLAPRRPASELLVKEQIHYIESLAPSGLRPLWIALLIVVAGAALIHLLG